METQSVTLELKDSASSSSLHYLVGQLASSLAPAATRNKNHIINNVQHDICSLANENVIATILGRLLNVVIMHTENSCVRISAKNYGNVTLLHVKDDGCLNYDSISHNLNEIQSMAEGIGGFVGFTSFRNKLTTIAFSFMNVKAAA